MALEICMLSIDDGPIYYAGSLLPNKWWKFCLCLGRTNEQSTHDIGVRMNTSIGMSKSSQELGLSKDVKIEKMYVGSFS